MCLQRRVSKLCHGAHAVWNLLAGSTVVEAECLVVRRGDELVAPVIKADPCDLSWVGRVVGSVWVCAGRGGRRRLDCSLEDLRRLQLCL